MPSTFSFCPGLILTWRQHSAKTAGRTRLNKNMPETPIEKLKKMTAWSTEPALTETELTNLLTESSVADAGGFAPLHEEWTPTYDFNAAAATGWLIKAGRSRELTEVDPPGSGITTSKVFDNCRSMARVYAAKRTTAVQLKQNIK